MCEAVAQILYVALPYRGEAGGESHFQVALQSQQSRHHHHHRLHLWQVDGQAGVRGGAGGGGEKAGSPVKQGQSCTVFRTSPAATMPRPATRKVGKIRSTMARLILRPRLPGLLMSSDRTLGLGLWAPAAPILPRAPGWLLPLLDLVGGVLCTKII